EVQRHTTKDCSLRNIRPDRRLVAELPEAVVLKLKTFVEEVVDLETGDAETLGKTVTDANIHNNKVVFSPLAERPWQLLHVLVYVGEAGAGEEPGRMKIDDADRHTDGLHLARLKRVEGGFLVELVVDETRPNRHFVQWCPV